MEIFLFILSIFLFIAALNPGGAGVIVTLFSYICTMLGGIYLGFMMMFYPKENALFWKRGISTKKIRIIGIVPFSVGTTMLIIYFIFVFTNLK